MANLGSKSFGFKSMQKTSKNQAVKKIIESNYSCIQFINHLQAEYQDIFKDQEKDNLLLLEKHLINMSDSMSKLTK